MSKYDKLWEYISQRNEESIVLSFEDIAEISGAEIDHSFLNYKKELFTYGYEVKKISMKSRTVLIIKTK